MNQAPQQQPQQSNQASVTGAQGSKSESLQRHAQELGLLGKLFGSADHAPLNIAGAILLLCLVAMVAAPFLPAEPNFSVSDMQKTFGGIALAAMTFAGGYLGGRGRA